jgi:pseudaminic acid cytidylyltransferase
MNVAIIPARGGSKRIPRKNIREFCGKPVLAWSIEAAVESRLFDRIIVSTDDVEIAEVARRWGAEVPFTRPAELSDDYAGTTEVIAHATRWMAGQGFDVKAVCCIYAAAPLVQAADLKRGLELLQSGDWAYVFPATDFPAPVFRAFRLREDGGIEMLFPEHFYARSQDLPTVLHDAGQFYWGRPAAWTENKRIFDHHSIPVMIPRWRVQDIDDQDDWERAVLIFNEMKQRQS